MSKLPVQFEYLGALPRLGLKGPAAARWLRNQSIPVPADILAAASIAGDAWIARVGAAEFLLEAGMECDWVSRLEAQLSALPAGVYIVPRCDATFVVSGPGALSVFAQTCAIDFRRTAPQRVIFTRIAGVNCGILPQASGGAVSYRMWCDYSYAGYLLDVLCEIVIVLGGTTHVPVLPATAVHVSS
jgi:sarcosine oxidase subunit gamma